MSKDPASRREERIKELLAWARVKRLDPMAVGTFDKLERQARLSYLVTRLTARDYARVALQLMAQGERSLVPSEPAGMDAGSNRQGA
jgi:hypothetical protein